MIKPMVIHTSPGLANSSNIYIVYREYSFITYDSENVDVYIFLQPYDYEKLYCISKTWWIRL